MRKSGLTKVFFLVNGHTSKINVVIGACFATAATLEGSLDLLAGNVAKKSFLFGFFTCSQLRLNFFVPLCKFLMRA